MADIGVKPSDHRVVDIHLRGHPIAKFTILEQLSYFQCVFLGTFIGSVIALRGPICCRRSSDMIFKV